MQIDEVLEAVAPKTSWYVVIRPFEGDNGPLVPSEVVDTSSWMYTKNLIELRYIRPLPYGVAVPELTKQADGSERRILTADTPLVDMSEKRPTPTRKK